MNANPENASHFCYCTCTKRELYLYIWATAFCSPFNDHEEDHVNVSVYCIANTVCLRKPYSCLKKSAAAKYTPPMRFVWGQSSEMWPTAFGFWPFPAAQTSNFHVLQAENNSARHRSRNTDTQRGYPEEVFLIQTLPLLARCGSQSSDWSVLNSAPCDVRLCALLCNLPGVLLDLSCRL